jgi:hypothetical protein
MHTCTYLLACTFIHTHTHTRTHARTPTYLSGGQASEAEHADLGGDEGPVLLSPLGL